MDFKLVSKNNMGVVMTLILVILLSQSRFFDFLTETPLGRMVLLAFIILIAYTNKILGLLAVLFIIIAFNQNDIGMVQSYNFYEGFDGSGNVVSDDKKAKAQVLKDNLAAKKEKAMDTVQTAATTSSSVSGDAREGFCMSDRELNMLRGKQSNTVPVFNKSREQNNEVDPTDKSVFTNSYASF